ncbi:hypothetical protein VTO42DRAFT_4538 [Malbranchea cinnamomea]
MPQRIDDAMIDVIGKLNSITEHLRKHNLDESSNKISKNTHEIVSVFTDVIVKLSEEEMIIPDKDKTSRQVPADHTTKKGNGNITNKSVENQYKHAIEKSRQANAPRTSPLTQDPTYQANSWAKVASAGSSSPGMHTNSGGVKLLQHKHIPLSQPAVPTGIIQPIETEEETAGVMIISGPFVLGSLNFLTSRIREGPLYDVEISYDNGLARIVFLRSAHALAFLNYDAELVAKRGFGRFGPGYSIVCTEMKDWDEGIRQMENRPKERRRLTFARAGFLGKPLTFRKFQSDVIEVAGVQAIDFIWAFNSGNVTTVFKSVDVARLVQKHFLQLASKPGPYKGVQVTFSTDPCEKQLVLSAQGAVTAVHSMAVHKGSQNIIRKR